MHEFQKDSFGRSSHEVKRGRQSFSLGSLILNIGLNLPEHSGFDDTDRVHSSGRGIHGYLAAHLRQACREHDVPRVWIRQQQRRARKPRRGLQSLPLGQGFEADPQGRKSRTRRQYPADRTYRCGVHHKHTGNRGGGSHGFGLGWWSKSLRGSRSRSSVATSKFVVRFRPLQ